MTDTLGSRFARAIAAKDEAALRGVLDVTGGETVADTARVRCSGFRPR